MQPIGSTVFFNFILAPSTSRRFKFHERGQLSLACITKRFLSARCASAILIVRRYSVKSGATLRGKCGRLANHGLLGCHGLGSAGFQLGCFGWASQNNSANPVGGGSASTRRILRPSSFSQAGRARIERSGFPAECYCDCVGGLSPTA
jgi:hypothetical protein